MCHRLRIWDPSLSISMLFFNVTGQCLQNKLKQIDKHLHKIKFSLLITEVLLAQTSMNK